jgi:hypothetical protein
MYVIAGLQIGGEVRKTGGGRTKEDQEERDEVKALLKCCRQSCNDVNGTIPKAGTDRRVSR